MRTHSLDAYLRDDGQRDPRLHAQHNTNLFTELLAKEDLEGDPKSILRLRLDSECEAEIRDARPE